MEIAKILQKLHIEELNNMQKDVADQMLHTHHDIIVLSPTGSGKTLAYLLPLAQLVDVQVPEVQAVVVVPGRELALQSDMVLRDMGTGLHSLSCYGGRPAMDEHKSIKAVKPQIVFATPGRLNDHLDKGNIIPDHVHYLIIDEFDKCLEMGFQDEMKRLLEKLPFLKRRILLSATDADAIPNFVSIDSAVRLSYLDGGEQVPDRVGVYEVRSLEKDKLETLSALLRHFGEQSSIVFLNYRDSVERTNDYLRAMGFSTSAFHGGMDQKQREDALYKFSNGSANIFVATDLASRGLDIPHINNIIHYHLPQGTEEYIHRVGRTARWKDEGRAFFIVGPNEEIPAYVNAHVSVYAIPSDLPKPAQPPMTTIYIGKGKNDKISKGDIVGFLCKKGGLQSDEIGRIDVKDRYAYVAVKREKSASMLRLVQGEKIKGVKTLIEPVR